MEGMCNDRNIRLQLICDESLDDVKLDASLFEQVLVNIIKNAAESIGQDGQIIIRTSLPTAIEVVDNGPGISKETEAKLFSPFFSTKPNGQGIGLIFIREVLSRHGCIVFIAYIRRRTDKIQDSISVILAISRHIHPVSV